MVADKPRQIDTHETFNALVADVVALEAPGLLIGISGTDSILAFLICAEAMNRAKRPERAVGIHYGSEATAFARIAIPWLREQTPGAKIFVNSSYGDRQDGARWGDLADRSILDIETSAYLPSGKNFWVVGTKNATEEALSSYSNMTKGVSIQPIMRLWKSEVLTICKDLRVPKEIINRSYIADCGCGSSDADMITMNPDIIDAILMTRQGILSSDFVAQNYPADTVRDLNAVIDRQLAKGDFKKRIPYVPSANAIITTAPK